MNRPPGMGVPLHDRWWLVLTLFVSLLGCRSATSSEIVGADPETSGAEHSGVGTARAESTPGSFRDCNSAPSTFEASEATVPLDDITIRHLVAACGLSSVQLSQDYPDFSLSDPPVRQRIILWLGSRAAPEPGAEELVEGALHSTSSTAVVTEVPMVSSFLQHENARVRLAANEYLLQLYFPEPRARRCVHQVLDRMTRDEDEGVRAAGIRFRNRVAEVDGRSD